MQSVGRTLPGVLLPSQINTAVLPHARRTSRKEVEPMIFLPREEGQGLVEYALIILFIAIVVLAVLLIFGPGLKNLYQYIYDWFMIATGG
jgi:pilus assembly protein Flp/PilA